MAQVAILACGALAREIRHVAQERGWDVDIHILPARLHNDPRAIVRAVEEELENLSPRYQRVIVAYGDCGTGGALDRVLERFPNARRLPGPHCYAIYGGKAYEEQMEKRPGTFFLTDFLARGFRGLVWKGLGLDRYPSLRDVYFQHYTDVVWLAQEEDPKTRARAEEAARLLGLPLTVIPTGYDALAEQIEALLPTAPSASPQEKEEEPKGQHRGGGSQEEVPEPIPPRLPDHHVQRVGQGGEEAAGAAEDHGQGQDVRG